jgi:hypothetical protein
MFTPKKIDERFRSGEKFWADTSRRSIEEEVSGAFEVNKERLATSTCAEVGTFDVPKQ